jgi:hypothetical protein
MLGGGRLSNGHAIFYTLMKMCYHFNMGCTKDEMVAAWELNLMIPAERVRFLRSANCYCYGTTSRYDEHTSVCPNNPYNKQLVMELLREYTRASA